MSKAEDLLKFSSFHAKENEWKKRENKDSRKRHWWIRKIIKENQAVRGLKCRKEVEEELALPEKSYSSFWGTKESKQSWRQIHIFFFTAYVWICMYICMWDLFLREAGRWFSLCMNFVKLEQGHLRLKKSKIWNFY